MTKKKRGHTPAATIECWPATAPARRAARASVAVPCRHYRPGYFGEVMQQWVPGWQPAPMQVSDPTRSDRARANRETMRATGSGWGDGTLPLAKTPPWQAPGWMGPHR